MYRSTTTTIALPIGSKPGWELQDNVDNGEAVQLKPIAESCVLLHALRQSRDKWLHSTFPKFSSKARGKTQTDTPPPPPPHTIQNRGKCDVEIGPHIFTDTFFYEIHYLPTQPAPTPAFSHPPFAGSWQSKTPYGTSLHSSAIPTNSADSSNSAETSSKPFISSFNSVTTITPSLINQVNSAASSNPTLANLLQLAAAGLATPEQLKTLGLLIQSLANSESSQAASPQVESTIAMNTPLVMPVKEFDLVLEFRENPSDRFLFPRGVATCEKTSASFATYAASDVLVRTCLPFSTAPSVVMSQAPGVNKDSFALQVVTMRLIRAPSTIWDTLSRWAGDEKKMEYNRTKLSSIQPMETYLGYQLSEGSLLSQLQQASSQPFAMKPLKASATNPRTRRKTIPRKSDATRLQGLDPNDKPSVVKRRRTIQPERADPSPIQCISCKNKDVPLILGGRFCRPCVEAGRAAPATPTPEVSVTVSHSNPTLSQENLTSIESENTIKPLEESVTI